MTARKDESEFRGVLYVVKLVVVARRESVNRASAKGVRPDETRYLDEGIVNFYYHEHPLRLLPDAIRSQD